MYYVQGILYMLKTNAASVKPRAESLGLAMKQMVKEKKRKI